MHIEEFLPRRGRGGGGLRCPVCGKYSLSVSAGEGCPFCGDGYATQAPVKPTEAPMLCKVICMKHRCSRAACACNDA